ncbi:putative E3 ubiquitin-protein ligase TM129 isoform 3 [Scophthalmus maximus]|uniref:Putative E3 ubiquitin-protein ligase TM129 isoform 3 n=1 Tax=Scophthalmus maximus TaxID=52904 RepID=A0A2U9CAE4_SCOMX|nr:E3 ubiquitin-protein ligase TM129 isoform X2 [Scophthalmus maximus]AWP12609.1 putative E3 ubiquitin-protein ligase TM129 isoform 3 [Scophthalmus maximus]
MESPELSFTLAYIVFCLCFVFTPSEFRSAGLTIQNLFSSCLGSEDVGFVQYHIRRTSVTVLVHSALPLGYYMGMCVAAPEKNLGYIHKVSDSWRLFLLLSICLQLASWTHVIYWSRRHWHNHPISRGLQAHVQPPHSGWGSMAASVNTEFRRIDKFSTGAPGARVIVTDSWVLKVTTYHVYMALQSECHVTVTESRQHQLTQDLASPAQILTLRVDSINPAIRHYDIRRWSPVSAVCRFQQTLSWSDSATQKELIMSQAASSVSADPCGVFPVWVDGSLAAKTNKDLRPGYPAESPAPPVEPNSVYWMSVGFTDKARQQIQNYLFI